MGDISALACSIREIGLLHPIVIDDKNQLIAGQRRLEACKLLGWERVPVHVVPLDDIVRGEFDENVVREDFTPSEQYAIRKALEEQEKQSAKDRQGERIDKHSGNFPESSRGQTRDKIAKIAGTSGRTLDKITEICKAAEAEPEKYGQFVDEMDRTGKVDGVYRKLRAELDAERRPMAELRTREDFAAAITTRWRDYFANIFRAGWLLVEMRDRGNGDLAAMHANEKLPMKRRTAKKCMAVAENETLADPDHWSQLPADLDALYELSRVPEDVLEGWLADGKVNADTEPKKVRRLLVMEKRGSLHAL